MLFPLIETGSKPGRNLVVYPVQLKDLICDKRVSTTGFFMKMNRIVHGKSIDQCPDPVGAGQAEVWMGCEADNGLKGIGQR